MCLFTMLLMNVDKNISAKYCKLLMDFLSDKTRSGMSIAEKKFWYIVFYIIFVMRKAHVCTHWKHCTHVAHIAEKKFWYIVFYIIFVMKQAHMFCNVIEKVNGNLLSMGKKRFFWVSRVKTTNPLSLMQWKHTPLGFRLGFH